MPADRRKLWLGIAGVVMVIVAVVWTSNGPDRSPAPAPPPRTPAAAAQTRPGEKPDGPPVPVNLEALKAERGQPADSRRDPFRFQPKPPPPSQLPTTPRPTNAGPLVPTLPTMPVGPPPPPPITLKFIGILTQGKTRLAVLTDGRSAPISGQEGETILGQYRILKIGTESIEMSYLDGRGRQTIRLTGQ
jgi:hypothetical protein